MSSEWKPPDRIWLVDDPALGSEPPRRWNSCDHPRQEQDQ